MVLAAEQTRATRPQRTQRLAEGPPPTCRRRLRPGAFAPFARKPRKLRNEPVEGLHCNLQCKPLFQGPWTRALCRSLPCGTPRAPPFQGVKKGGGGGGPADVRRPCPVPPRDDLGALGQAFV